MICARITNYVVTSIPTSGTNLIRNLDVDRCCVYYFTIYLRNVFIAHINTEHEFYMKIELHVLLTFASINSIWFLYPVLYTCIARIMSWYSVLYLNIIRSIIYTHHIFMHCIQVLTFYILALVSWI